MRTWIIADKFRALAGFLMSVPGVFDHKRSNDPAAKPCTIRRAGVEFRSGLGEVLGRQWTEWRSRRLPRD